MEKKLILASLLTLIGLAVVSFNGANDSVDSFTEWKQQYGVNWGTEEDVYRRMVFEENFAKMTKHNADQSQSYKMGLNQFTVYTDDEFMSLFLDPKPASSAPEVADETMPSNADIDWTTQKMVSRVKNQGQCGSCWAFSATGVMESWALKKGQNVDLSEQQLVDCTSSYGNQGCNGGWPNKAMEYVRDHGLSSQSDYPYTARTGSCRIQGGSFKISAVKSATGCNDLANALMAEPISVTVDASNWSRYSSGVFSNCGTSINHAVLLVGLSDSFWKIKNSWGGSWGESGFIRLARGNTCGVCMYPSPWPA